MTHDEFNTWLEAHRIAFPGIDTWLGRLATDRQQAILKFWRSRLQDVDLVDAKEASEALAADADFQAAYERHPAYVLHRARLASQVRRTSERAAGRYRSDPTYRCPLCGDTGVVSVWSPRAMRAARDGARERPAFYWHALARCGCEASAGKPEAMPRYDSRCMCPCGGNPDATQWEALIDWISSKTRGEPIEAAEWDPNRALPSESELF